jgi:hypothetical protein
MRPEAPSSGCRAASIVPVSRATIAATIVEMDDGRVALLVEMEPAPGQGPWVVESAADPTTVADPDGREEHG